MSTIASSILITGAPQLASCAGFWWRVLLITAGCWLLPNLAYAADAEPAPALNTTVCAPDAVALGGYDIVSYHLQDAPQLGNETIYAEHEELIYHFVSPQNRAIFLAAPGKYLPNYHGWCSTNLSMGRLACPDYTNYKFEDGKLLFFERIGFTNGLDVWNSDPQLHKRQADRNFALFSTRQ